jgi:glycosyltransferase involved in cell wall biosynthesis
VVSVVIPVAGRERRDSFERVLSSFRGQSMRRFEVVLVEHAEEPCYAHHEGRGVRYVHVARRADERFNKAKALNAGVQASRARSLVLHDADIVVPADYLRATSTCLEQGWDVVQPLRFLFLLSPEQTTRFLEGPGFPVPRVVRDVQQNFAGGSTAVAKDAYVGVGGHDERFEGWGGEDTDFLCRLRGHRRMPGSFAPGVHLWHAPAPEKAGERNRELMGRIAQEDPEARTRELRRRWHEAEDARPRA